MLKLIQNKDIIEIHNDVLSGKLSRFPLDTWTNKKECKANLLKLIRHTVNERLKWNREEFCQSFCLQVIVEFRLNGGFARAYNRNIYPLITDAFPEWNIRAWELSKSRVPAEFWTKETGIAATKWLVEERLQWSLEKVQRDISNSHFLKNNLGGLLRTLDTGAISMILLAYPNHDWTYLIERAGYKLTKAQVREIKLLLREGIYSQRKIAQMFNTEPSTINLIAKGKLHRDICVKRQESLN